MVSLKHYALSVALLSAVTVNAFTGPGMCFLASSNRYRYINEGTKATFYTPYGFAPQTLMVSRFLSVCMTVVRIAESRFRYNVN